MKSWEINHNGNVIRVENSVSGERLYVNDELQDEQIGFGVRARLWGQLHTGEKIKVSLGGWFVVNCRIFIDHKMVLPK